MKKIAKKLVSVFLSAVMVLELPVSGLAGEVTGQTAQTEAGQSDQGQGSLSEAAGSFVSQITDDQTNYYEVKFELGEEFVWATEDGREPVYIPVEETEEASGEESFPEETVLPQEDWQEEAPVTEETTAYDEEETEGEEAWPEEEVPQLTMPETAMVREGTLIASLPSPELTGYVFLGWYFDSELQNRVSTEDVVSRNLTLYARFGSANGEDGEFVIDFVGEEDVEPDYPVYLASYGLSEEEIREKLILKDFNAPEETSPFILQAVEPNLEILIPEEEARTIAADLLEAYQNGEPLEPVLIAAGKLEQEEEDFPEEETEDEEAETAGEENAEGAEAEQEGADEETAQTTAQEGAGEENAEAAEEGAGEESAEAAEEGEESTETAEEGEGEESAEDAQEALTLGKALDLAGVPRPVILHLLKFYEPDDMAADMFFRDELTSELNALGLSGDETQEELIITLKQSFLTEEELLEYLNNELAFDIDKLSQLEKMEAGEFFERLALHARQSTEDEKLPVFWRLLPEEGSWIRGHNYQVELLNNEGLRYLKDGEVTDDKVIYYNLSVFMEDYSDMTLNPGISFVPASEVSGVDFSASLFHVEQDENGEFYTVRNNASGVLTTGGSYSPGDIIAVHDGTVSAATLSDEDKVVYVKIDQDLGGGQYSYVTPELEEVMFKPDNIPVKDDGSFGDGQILLTADQMDFTGPDYAQIGLGPDTVIEPGDLITVYSGSLDAPESVALVGYGKITGAQTAEGGLQLSYDILDEEGFSRASGFAVTRDNVEIPFSDEELEELARGAADDLIADGGFIEQTRDYLEALLMADESLIDEAGLSDKLDSLKFTTEDGEEISLEEVRALADGEGGFHWDPKPTVSYQASLFLKHFSGTGIRLMVAVDWGGNYNFQSKGSLFGVSGEEKDNTLRINFGAQLEVEIVVGVTCDAYIHWHPVKAWGVTIFKYPDDIVATIGAYAGIFTVAGVTLRVQTQKLLPEKQEVEAAFDSIAKKATLSEKNEDKQLGALLTLGAVAAKGTSMLESLEKFTDGIHSPGAQNHDTLGGGGSNPAFQAYNRYSSFLQNNADYVPLFQKKLKDHDPPLASFFGIMAVSLGITFKIMVKVNLVAGLTVSYQNVKQWTVTINVFEGKAKKNDRTMLPPEFRFDVFGFGMFGLKISFEFDFRIGVVSTKLASLGLVLEMGCRAELFGFLYFSIYWRSGEGWQQEFTGNVYFRFDIFAMLKFKIQAGDGRVGKDWDLLNLTIPLFSFGSEHVIVDFKIDRNDEKLKIDLGDKTSAQLPGNLYELKTMSMTTGLNSSMNFDTSDKIESSRKPVESLGSVYKQYDEKFFEVECQDVDANGQSTGTNSWLYDPATNTVSVKPHDLSVGELWGEITFSFRRKTQAFATGTNPDDKVSAFMNFAAGFGTEKDNIRRTVKVHWKGKPVTVPVNIYVPNEPSHVIENLTELYQNGGEALARMYSKRQEFTIKGYEGFSYVLPADNEMFVQPDMDLTFAVTQIQPDLVSFYSCHGTKTEDTSLANKLRCEVYGKTGRLWMHPDDLIHAIYLSEGGSVDLFFNYKPVDAWWYVMNGENGAAVMNGIHSRVLQSIPALDLIPGLVTMVTGNSGYEYKVHALTDTSPARNIGLETLKKRQGEWIEATEDWKTPAVPAVYFVVTVSRKPLKITWKYEDGDEVTEAKIGDRIRAPKEIEEKDGKYLAGWADEDGVTYPNMPDHDLVLYPVYLGKSHTISWLLDKARYYTHARTGEPVFENCPYSPRSEDEELWWSTTRGGEDYVSADLLMPDRNLTLYGSYHTFRNVRWMYGDMELAATREETGKPLKLLQPEPRPGYTLVWTKDGRRLPEGYVMPDEDIVLQAVWFDDDHIHQFVPTEEYVLPTCIAGSRRHVICSVCLLEEDQVLPPDEDAHSWGEPVYTWSEDNKTVSAKRVCRLNGGHVETETVRTVSETLEAADCHKAGTARFTASFTNPAFASQEKVVQLPQFEHIPGYTKVEVIKASTCKEEGLNNLVTYCRLCGDEIRREEAVSEKKDHKAGKTVTENIVTGTCSTEGTCDSVVYCRVCGEELSRRHIIMNKDESVHAEGEPVTENEKEASCTAEGSFEKVIYCTDCGKELSRETVVIPMTEHTPGEEETENKKEATCTEEGSYDKVVRCTVCGQELSRETVVIPMTEHTPGGEETENEKEATCTEEGSYDKVVRCTVCGQELSRETVVIPMTEHTPGGEETENEKKATCTEEGSCDKVVRCTVCGKELSRETVVIPATGHSWSSWNTVKPASEEEEGLEERICGNNPEHKETRVIMPLEHVHVLEKTDAVAPGCTEDGNIAYWHCTNAKCGRYFADENAETELNPEELVIPATGHEWGEVKVEWKQETDPETGETICTGVTATRVCAHDESHVETETVGETMTSEVTKPAACEERGETTYTAVFENEAFGVQKKTVENIAALGHAWGEVTYFWAEGKDSASGETVYTGVTASRVCSHDETHVETETVKEVTSAVTRPAACEAKGETTYTSGSFVNKAFTAQTKSIDNIPALGHEWGEVKVEWKQEKDPETGETICTGVTATRVCTHDESHVETETVGETMTSEVTKPATCEGRGETTYTAEFENKAFGVQKKTVENIAAIGHAWGEVKVDWKQEVDPETGETICTGVTATRVCTHDESHVETETVDETLTSEVTKHATCEGRGETTYTAEFENKAFGVQKKTVENIAALDHEWGEVKIDWMKEEDPETGETICTGATATRVCTRDESHVETETVETLTSEVTKPATCEGKGETTYTAVFENKAFAAAKVTLENVPALGHAWGETTYTWEEEKDEDTGKVTAYTRVTAEHVCTRDESHTETETVDVDESVSKKATCYEMGETTYTAEFPEYGFEKVSKKLTNIEKLEHDWGTVSYTWNGTKDSNGQFTSITSLTVEATCKNDWEEDHPFNETIQVKAMDVTREEPDCENPGYVIYSVTFDNDDPDAPQRSVDPLRVDLPALGHEWGDIIFTWGDGNTTLKASRICSRDPLNHIEEETVNVDITETKATCDDPSMRYFTPRNFTNGSFYGEQQRRRDELEKEELIGPELGHDFVGKRIGAYVDENQNFHNSYIEYTCKRVNNGEVCGYLYSDGYEQLTARFTNLPGGGECEDDGDYHVEYNDLIYLTPRDLAEHIIVCPSSKTYAGNTLYGYENVKDYQIRGEFKARSDEWNRQFSDLLQDINMEEVPVSFIYTIYETETFINQVSFTLWIENPYYN